MMKPKHNHIRLRWGGITNIENRIALRKEMLACSG